MMTAQDMVGKTIESLEEEWFGNRSWWTFCFTDGSQIRLMSDCDFSDITTGIEVCDEQTYADHKADEEWEDE